MRAPVDIVNVSSAYGVFRPRQGAMHWGVDLAQPRGAPVLAPEPMVIEVMRVGAGTSTKLAAPLDGYGPGALIARGESGVWHVLAHLDPEWWSTHAELPVVGRRYDEGSQVGASPSAVGASGPHVHWEVRTGRAVDSPATRGANTVDPMRWLDGDSSWFEAAKRAGEAAVAAYRRRKMTEYLAVAAVLYLALRR